LELLARKIGFLPENQLVFGQDTVQTIFLFPVPFAGTIYGKLKDDGNPFRTFLDLHLLVFRQIPSYYVVWGELLLNATNNGEKIIFNNLQPTLLGENVKNFLQEEWKKIRQKTTPLPLPIMKNG
jgi:hypothetical protein